MHEQRSVSRRVRFGVFELDLRSGELHKGPSRLKVPDKSIEILRALIEQPGELVTREALRDRLWPANTFVDFEHGLNAAVRRLRDALGDSAEDPQFIETLPRRGYRFVGTIERVAVPAGSDAPEPRVASAPVGDAAAISHDHRAAVHAGRRGHFAWIAAGAVAVILLTAITVALVRQQRPPDGPAEPTLFTIAPPADTQFGPTPEFAVSPDGKLFVFVAVSKGERFLWLKSRSSPTATRVPGTEGASYPFWSADNKSVGFFAARQLKTHRLGTTIAETICDAPFGRGATWNDRDEIVFAPSTDADLMKVSASGGPAVVITRRDSRRGDTTHRLPEFLPDGRHFLFWAGGGRTTADIQIGSLDSPGTITSIGLPSETAPSPGKATYSAGHILFLRERRLFAQPFDIDRRVLTSGAVMIAEDVTSYSVSAAGVLAHATTRRPELRWFDRGGRPLEKVADKSFMVALSHDDTRLATGNWGGELVLYDLTQTAEPRRFTSVRANEFFPVWSPDGSEVVFSSTRNSRYQIFRKPTDFSHEETVLLDSTPSRPVVAATDWSADGQHIAYTESGGDQPTQIWMLPLAGARTPFRFRQVKANEGNAHFSPDGKWVVFTSEEQGSRGEGSVSRREIFVAAFSGGGPVFKISDSGGLQPFWSRDGNEIFFLSLDDGLMSARVTQGRRFTAERARKLFPIAVNTSEGWGNQYAASRDGKRFLVNALLEQSPITYVLDWLALTKQSGS